jgi:hypothetical protein
VLAASYLLFLAASEELVVKMLYNITAPPYWIQVRRASE